MGTSPEALSGEDSFAGAKEPKRKGVLIIRQTIKYLKQRIYLVAYAVLLATTITLALVVAIFVITFASMTHAEWRPEEAPETVPGIQVPFAQKADLEVDREMRSLEWRCVGPFVGVRGCGVAMHPTDKNRFYHAHSSGGVWMTEDNGLYWLPITDGQINVGPVGAIALAPSNPDIIYIGTGEPQLRDCSTWGDGAYKSIDGGKTWTNMSKNFPQSEITRTIREDKVRKGLLFVGTETGVFASLDDGATWKRLNLNLPAVPVHDMKIKDEDLCIATFGRSFWIMDDISPLRQTSKEIQDKKAHLFKPRKHTRLGINWWALYGGGVGGGQKNYFVQNGRMGHTFIELGVVNGERKRKFLNAGGARPRGAIIYYLLGKDVKKISLSILDSQGKLIKTYEGDILSQEVGLNRMIWDMNYPDVVSVPGKPPAGIVVEAKPGTYTAKLTVDGQSQEQRFKLCMNPNETWTQADADARFKLWWRIRDIFERANTTIIAAMELSKEAGEDSEITKQAVAFSGKLVPMGANLSQIANEPSKLLSKLQTVHWVLFQSEGRPPQSAYDVVDMLEKEIDAEIAAWNAFKVKTGK